MTLTMTMIAIQFATSGSAPAVHQLRFETLMSAVQMSFDFDTACYWCTSSEASHGLQTRMRACAFSVGSHTEGQPMINARANVPWMNRHG